MKFKITWWFLDSVEGISRGTDYIEIDESDFDEDDALIIMDEEMAVPNVIGYKPKFPNLYKNTMSPEPISWGVLNVKKEN